MKFSLKYLQKFLDPAPPAEEIPDLLTFCGLEVEETKAWHSLPGGLKNFVTGRVLEVWPHPGADRLRCTRVDAGLERPLQVICGAPNVAAGQSVIVALEGAEIHLPGIEPFIIKKTKIRGELSEGMICAEDEIGLGTSHEGILVLPDSPAPGTPAARYLAVYSDTIITVNITPNRPDATSYLGLARDICAALNARNRATRMARETLVKAALTQGSCPVRFIVKNPESCAAYAGVLVEGLAVGPSPDWLRYLLESCGHKSINNVVDTANLVMLETGQPLHFFDADTLSGEVEIRHAREGEKMMFLDGVERELMPHDLVIADSEGPHCLAGIMGGRRTAVTQATRRIFIEAAWFQPGMIRRSARHHKLQTEASYRFERHADPMALVPALERALHVLKETCGAASHSTYALFKTDSWPSPLVKFATERLNNFLGTGFGKPFVQKILEDLEFRIVEENNDSLTITPPSFKPDVQRFEDVAEEVIRIAGYHHLGEASEMRFTPPARSTTERYTLRRRLATRMADIGLQEVISYPMINPDLAVTHDHRVRLANPISSELAWMRASLLESMLPVAAHNLRRQQTDVRLFEVGRTFLLLDGHPHETEKLGMLTTGRRLPESWINPSLPADLFYLKGLISHMLPLAQWEKAGEDKAFSEKYLIRLPQGSEVGWAGVIKPLWLKKLDIRQPVFFAEILLDSVLQEHEAPRRFPQPPRFPEVRRDLAFVVDKSVAWRLMENEIRAAAGPLLRRLILFDVYEGKNLPEGKYSLAMGLIFRHDERTLTDEEVNNAIGQVISRIEAKFKAELRT